jgi:hypothetical protein
VRVIFTACAPWSIRQRPVIAAAGYSFKPLPGRTVWQSGAAHRLW